MSRFAVVSWCSLSVRRSKGPSPTHLFMIGFSLPFFFSSFSIVIILLPAPNPLRLSFSLFTERVTCPGRDSTN